MNKNIDRLKKNNDERKLLMILNPRSGKTHAREDLFDAVCAFCGGGFLLKIQSTTAPGDAAKIAAEQGENFDAVVCVGGDGTLNETIAGLMQLKSPPPLAYLPRGSTNDFAASLQIPMDNLAAAQAAMDASPRKLDIGKWNDRHFVYVASFGAFAKSSYTASQAAKNALGHFAYILEGMRDLTTIRPYNLHITADGETLDGEYLFGAVCNSTSIGGLMKLEHQRVILDDGYFEMLLIPNPKSPGDLNNILLALLNQEYDRGGLVFRHVKQVRIETEEELPWSLDGEYAPTQPVVTIENLQQALTFLL